MNLIKNCFLHGRYEGDECIGCAFMRKERGTDKDAELVALRAEVERLRELCEAFRRTPRRARRAVCEEENDTP